MFEKYGEKSVKEKEWKDKNQFFFLLEKLKAVTLNQEHSIESFSNLTS